MSTTNQRTVATYEAHATDYIALTNKSDAVRAWLDQIVDPYPLSAKIFEIGSGTGEDARYLELHGYKVQTSDVTHAFVEYLRENGHDAIIWNALTDRFPECYDIIFADAVLLHFTEHETIATIKKVAGALEPNGTFSFTLKAGSGDEWTIDKLGDKRFFQYWEKASIEACLRDAGFTSITIQENTNDRGVAWLFITAKL